MVAKVLPSPMLAQVTPRTIEGLYAAQGMNTRQVGDAFREHARAINQLIDALGLARADITALKSRVTDLENAP